MKDSEKLKLKSQIAKHEFNVAEYDYKIAEQQENIERLKANREQQLEIIKTLKEKIGA